MLGHLLSHGGEWASRGIASRAATSEDPVEMFPEDDGSGAPCERIREHSGRVPECKALEFPRISPRNMVQIPSPDPNRAPQRGPRRHREPPALGQRGGLESETEMAKVSCTVGSR